MRSGPDTAAVQTASFNEATTWAAGALRDGAARSFCLTAWWWRTMLAAGLPDGAGPRFLIHGESPDTTCLLPLCAGPGRRLEGLAGPYTALYQPLFTADARPETIHRAGVAFAKPLRKAAVVRLDAIDAEAHWLSPFLAGLRAGGLHPLRFDHFGNWHEPLEGRGWDAYLRARSGALRETIRRKTRRNSDVEFRLVTGGGGLEEAIAGYEDVYARSWKIPEPFPRFNPQMMRAAAAAGALRLGLLLQGSQVIAAQIWILANRSAMVVKLAHDEAFKPLSPGTVLTALMIRHLIEEEHAEELDFGRGDDPYKELWTTRRRQRIGFLFADPWHPAGALAIARHVAGHLRRSLGR